MNKGTKKVNLFSKTKDIFSLDGIKLRFSKSNFLPGSFIHPYESELETIVRPEGLIG